MSQLAAVKASSSARPTLKSLRARIEELITAGLSIPGLAVEIGVKESELLSWLKGMPVEQLEAKLNDWYVEREQRQDEEKPGFILTPTSERIFAALETAQRERCIALCYGGAGVGKTLAAKEYIKQITTEKPRSQYYETSPSLPLPSSRPRCLYVVAGALLSSPTALLGSLADAAGIGTSHAYRAHALAAAVLGRLQPGDLICIDEAQFLEGTALDSLRYFLDEGGVGIAYLGNLELYTRLEGAGRQARFAQLSSRVGVRLPLNHPQEQDVDALLSAWRISGREERAFAMELGTAQGGLRVLGRLLSRSRDVAKMLGKPVNLQIMRCAGAMDSRSSGG